MDQLPADTGQAPDLSTRAVSYRAGYPPALRRQLERDIFHRKVWSKRLETHWHRYTEKENYKLKACCVTAQFTAYLLCKVIGFASALAFRFVFVQRIPVGAWRCLYQCFGAWH